MYLSYVDWLIPIALIGFMTFMAMYTRKYTRSVADFLAANRTAGRYLLCIADGMAALGSITIVMMFEIYYKSGFPGAWWDMMRMVIIPAALSLSGWVIYRFRQTRALTIAQFFEMRYSKNFRVFCGILIWFSGIVNFGIFPAVGARFFINFVGLPDTMGVYMFVMAVLIFFALFFTFMGGQIAVMVTDFIQGIFCNIMFIIIVAVALVKFDWSDIVYAVSNSQTEASLVNPFNVSNAEDFNLWFYLILSFTAMYGFLSWQGGQGYNSAALNAHEARMGKSLAVWRLLAQSVFVLVLPICAYTFMHHPDFLAKALPAKEALANISNDTIRNQAAVPVALRYFLPTGIMGGLCAVMLAATIATHDTYMHSWGSIFIQDVLLPFRKTPLTQKEHIKWLKISILGVAVFIYIFSLVFKQTEAIIMFFQVTGAIFVGGAGSVIIGGLYWKRGTTQGAWSGMLTGSTIAVTGIVLKQIHEYLPFTNIVMVKIVNQNGAYISFYAAAMAIIVYVVVSLLTCKRKYDLDKLLHRGVYAVKQDKTEVERKPIGKLSKIIGINHDFNKKDRVVYIAMFSWTLFLIMLFISITVISLLRPLSNGFWLGFWKYYIGISFVLAIVATVWFFCGGIVDLKKMFGRLKERGVDEVDDGRVIEDYGQNDPSLEEHEVEK